MRLVFAIGVAFLFGIALAPQPAAAKLNACAALSEADAARMMGAPSASSRAEAPSTNPGSTDAALVQGASDVSICSYSGPKGPKDAELRIVLVKYNSASAAASVAAQSRKLMTSRKIPGWTMGSDVEQGAQVDWYVIGSTSHYSATAANAFVGDGASSVFLTGGSTPPGQVRALAVKLAKSSQ